VERDAALAGVEEVAVAAKHSQVLDGARGKHLRVAERGGGWGGGKGVAVRKGVCCCQSHPSQHRARAGRHWQGGQVRVAKGLGEANSNVLQHGSA
jgi:hypothetical protein